MLWKSFLLFVAAGLVAVVALARAHEDTAPLIVEAQPIAGWDFERAADVVPVPQRPPREAPAEPSDDASNVPWRLLTVCHIDESNLPPRPVDRT